MVSESHKAKRTPTTMRLKNVLMGHFTFSPASGTGMWRSSRYTMHAAPLPGHNRQPRSSLQDGGCSVLTWAERWGQDVLIYSPCHCDLQQQSNCCSEKKKKKKKNSLQHIHTLQGTPGQKRIIYSDIKRLHPVSGVKNKTQQIFILNTWSDGSDLISHWLFTFDSISFGNEITALTFNLTVGWLYQRQRRMQRSA